MKKNLIKKIFILFSASLFLLTIFLNLRTYAATSVGQALPTPESGWQRYEELAPGFTFEGNGWQIPTAGSYSGGSEKFTLNPTLHSVKFQFWGTDLRLISYRGGDRQTSIQVNIDGVDYNYSANGQAQVTTLLFEKRNLENKLHSVVVSASNSSVYNLFEFDALDINDTGYLVNPKISVPSNLFAKAGDAKIDLSWTASSDKIEYTIKRSTTSAGPYDTIASNVKTPSYSDTSVVNGTTYYYVVTAVSNNGESELSKEASATPQGEKQTDPDTDNPSQPNPEPSEPAQPTGDRAILVVTMTNGFEKEFDLSMKEINNFIAWYDAKDAGRGQSFYKIDKHDNNKGPFSSRKDYVIFDKILTFEVSEFSK
ncbi:fibronectin type III domain-containing protein [Paenibacillus polymyxa]|uniref:Fibronectin type III domain-containing protein n=1 Tax=Paenibacillus polymyxa TaxID=1406 RepID=A0A8I1IXR2_PAEPO|nr:MULTISPECIES: fibronectin type III domain-containing protein [Paenibacillus]KAF6572389.1 fibronectin type III domain-containing protein [Paenibacillus sp. EKM206P]KAF6586800.1 fibronectin type III domain-containing protein [Paenibacillus sp. EKM205P]MBM0635043.1 fibronectin type III domain-containing protein [Paenibacillus polymyxa]